MPNSVLTRNREIIRTPRQHLGGRWWKNLLQGFILLILVIAFLEYFFRMAGVGCGQFLQPDLQMGTVHISGKQVVWRTEGYSNNKMNSVGLRDTEHKIAKEAGTYRIALLGDSLVEALQVDLNDTFGKKLEFLLNDFDKQKHYETINFGCGGYSTGQEFLVYQHQALKYKPDAVVLLYNRSDSMESIVKQKERNKAEPRPYFYMDENGMLKEDDSVLTANYNKLKPNLILDWLRKYSTVYGVVCQADFSLNLNEPLYRKIKGWVMRVMGIEQGRHICRPYAAAPTILSHMVGPEQRGAASGPYESEVYPDQDEMVVTKALITKLAAQAAENGQKFILVIYPNTDHFAPLTEQAKQLKALAEENHFCYLDLSPSFFADPYPRSNFELYHFNRKGHITVANQLFRVFRSVI